MKRKPSQLGQSPALELGCIWIAMIAIRKGVHYTIPPYCPPKGDCGGLHSPREALRAQRGAHPLDNLEFALDIEHETSRKDQDRRFAKI